MDLHSILSSSGPDSAERQALVLFSYLPRARRTGQHSFLLVEQKLKLRERMC